jgi:hypothetical protein
MVLYALQFGFSSYDRDYGFSSGWMTDFDLHKVLF